MGSLLHQAGADVTNIEMAHYPLALFDADFEKTKGEPEAAIALAQLFAGADIIFIASPEYNGSLSPLLKNTLDWISRQRVKPYSRAIFGVGAASPGKMGGIGGLGHLREILHKLGALVAPVSLGVGNAGDAFDSAGQLNDEATRNRADRLVSQMMGISRSG
jgi:chromate reductase, NAD(P)H dehydrogenase (quinone)